MQYYILYIILNKNVMKLKVINYYYETIKEKILNVVEKIMYISLR